MKNISVYVGFVALGQQPDGHHQVSVAKGISWYGLDQLQLTILEDILNSEFSEEVDALNRKIADRTVELGYANEQLAGDSTNEEFSQLRGLVDQVKGSRGRGQGQPPTRAG